MERKYTFRHEVDGKDTYRLNVPDDVLDNDALAGFTALNMARGLHQDGIQQGVVVVEGYWGARGFREEIPLKDVERRKHPYDKLSQTPCSGYASAANIIARLWPWEGKQPVGEKSLEFTVWMGKVRVKISRPRGNLIQMYYNDQMVAAYHLAPSEFTFVTTWSVSVKEARAIWKEVLTKIKAYETVYLK